MWLARSRPIRLLLLAWGISYAGDLAAFTVASVYLYGAGGAFLGLCSRQSWRDSHGSDSIPGPGCSAQRTGLPAARQSAQNAIRLSVTLLTARLSAC